MQQQWTEMQVCKPEAYQIIAAGLDKLQEYENRALMNPTYAIATSKHVYT
jgi:hypothetical protein